LPEPAAPWWSHVLFWQEWLSYPEKAYAAVVATAMAALLLVGAVLWRSTRLRWLSVALGVFAVVMAIDAGLDHREVESSRRGVVTTETIARKGIGESYEPAFDQPLKDGAEFTILMENGDWIFGHFEGIGDGWLKREVVAL